MNASEASAQPFNNDQNDIECPCDYVCGGGTFNSFLLRPTIIWQTVLFHLSNRRISSGVQQFPFPVQIKTKISYMELH